MPSSLKYKKIYVYSKFRSPGSESSSDFKIELPETMSFNENTVFYLDDICIPHSWDTVIDGVNNKLYFKLYVTNTSQGTETEFHQIATIQAGNYPRPDLATEIQTKMDDIAQHLTFVADMFTCAYQAKIIKIQISVKNRPYKNFFV